MDLCFQSLTSVQLYVSGVSSSSARRIFKLFTKKFAQELYPVWVKFPGDRAGIESVRQRRSVIDNAIFTCVIVHNMLLWYDGRFVVEGVDPGSPERGQGPLLP